MAIQMKMNMYCQQQNCSPFFTMLLGIPPDMGQHSQFFTVGKNDAFQPLHKYISQTVSNTATVTINYQ